MPESKQKNIKRIYLDNAATTVMAKEVLEEMTPYFIEATANPSALHFDGRQAKNVLASVRQKVAKIINAEPGELIFCGSGTESDNLAILGLARFYKLKGNHLISTNIEHHAVLHPLEHLKEKEAFEVLNLEVENNGIINAEKIIENIRPETILISVMYANNEIGTIQPIKD